MSICWWCYWGWPRAIMDIYIRARDDIDDLLPVPGPENDWTDWQGEPTCGESALKWGPTHCVWEDENFGGGFGYEHAECDRIEKLENWYPGTMNIVRRSLRELEALPEGVLDPAPGYCENGDDEPEDFPPWSPLLMEKT